MIWSVVAAGSFFSSSSTLAQVDGQTKPAPARTTDQNDVMIWSVVAAGSFFSSSTLASLWLVVLSCVGCPFFVTSTG